MAVLEGKVWRYGDNIDTDVIIPARYLNTFDPKELAYHCMVDIDPTFAKEVKAGDIMVGGRNFGCGSSREHAPVAIKASGIPVIIAESFARIFYRNGINVGLPLLEIGKDVEKIHAGDILKVDLSIGFQFEWKEAGGTAYDHTGSPLPEETIESCRKADAVLFGAVGGDQWDHLTPDLRPEKAILGLRKQLGLYVNLRPVRISDSMIDYSPLKPEIAKGTDIMIVRELVGGIYFGDRCESEIHNGAERAWDLENYSVPEVERIARFAFEAARKRKNHVTSVDKSNVLATSRLWRRTVIRVHDEEYPDVKLDHMYVDNCAQQFAIHPSFFDVVVTGNMFGDILSDEMAEIAGSLGMLPSASLREDSFGLYEPSGGSAPDIAGQNIANPLATILSAAMLLRYSLNLTKEADAIEDAVAEALRTGFRTGDIMEDGVEGLTCLHTDEMGDKIASLIR